MEVKENHVISNDHSLEWGNSTWDGGFVESIRNRYDAKGGRFNKSSSSEIPLKDFIVMINESIRRDKFTNSEVSEILKNIADNYIK